MTHLKKAINYVVENLSDLDAVRICKHFTLPLHVTNYRLYEEIYDLMEEYGEENDLPENWWLDYTDEDGIFNEVCKIID